MSSKTRIVVPVHDTNKFTEQDLETTYKLVVPEAHPELYGEQLMPSLVYLGRYIVNIDDIEWESKEQNTQTARAGGGNPRYKEIRQDIRTNGFKLKHPPIALRRLKNGALVPLNGRTRKMILMELGFKNLIVDIYEKDSDASWDKFDDESSQFGPLANANNDPAGNVSLEDVYRECIHAIQKGWIENDLSEIANRVNFVCGKGKFTQAKRDDVVFRVHNNFCDSEEFQILSWKSLSSISLWMETKNYHDTDDFIYYVVSHSTPSKAITGAAAAAFDNPGKEVRVVIHTSTLKSYDLEYCYVKRIQDFVASWENILQKVSTGFFEGKVRTKNPIKLYGALPAVSSLHDLDKIVTLNSVKKAEIRLLKEREERALYGEETEFEEDEEEFI